MMKKSVYQFLCITSFKRINETKLPLQDIVLSVLIKNTLDVIGLNCFRDKSGLLKVRANDRKQIWKKYMERLMNVENK